MSKGDEIRVVGRILLKSLLKNDYKVHKEF